MHSFVINTKPKSYNSWVGAKPVKKAKYKQLIENAFWQAYPAHIVIKTDLYGLVYHFSRKDIGIDADNLSKPIWDCLRGILFDDDKRVKMRMAGSFDLTANDLTVLDFLTEEVFPFNFDVILTYNENHVLTLTNAEKLAVDVSSFSE